MRRRHSLRVAVLAGGLALLSATQDGVARVGNASVTIHAGTAPANEVSQATLYDLGGGQFDIAVKLPGHTQSYILSRPCGFLPGWSASKAGDTVTATAPDGRKYIYTLALGYKLASIQDSAGQTLVTYQYDGNGRIDRQIDAFDADLYYEYHYDGNGKLTEVVAVDDNTSTSRTYTIEYDAAGLAKAITNACPSCGAGLKYEYNANGLLQHVRNNSDQIVYEYAYDAEGRMTDKYLGAVGLGNHVQRCVYTAGEGGNYIADLYDYLDATNYRVTREYRDSAGRATKRITHKNLNDNPNSPSGQTFTEHTVYYFNGQNMVTKKAVIPPAANAGDPDPEALTGVRREYTYDPETSQVLTETWYDANDVATTRAVYTYEYITQGSEVFDARVLTYTDVRQAVTTYDYTDPDDVVPERKTMPQVSGLLGTTQLKYEYTYDNQNRVTLEKKLDAGDTLLVQTKYEYDNYGNLKKRYDDFGGPNQEVTQYEYNGFNEMIRIILPSGVQQGTSYYDDGRVEYEVVHDPATPGNVFSQTTYEYDSDGRLVVMRQAKHTGSFVLGSPSAWIETQYEYDIEGNRTRVIEDVGGLGLQTTYEYNNQGEVTKTTLPTGKWTETIRDGRGMVTETRIGHGTTTVATSTYSYDANGNVVEEVAPDGSRTTYEYDDFDRRTKVTRGL